MSRPVPYGLSYIIEGIPQSTQNYVLVGPFFNGEPLRAARFGDRTAFRSPQPVNKQ